MYMCMRESMLGGGGERGEEGRQMHFNSSAVHHEHANHTCIEHAYGIVHVHVRKIDVTSMPIIHSTNMHRDCAKAFHVREIVSACVCVCMSTFVGVSDDRTAYRSRSCCMRRTLFCSLRFAVHPISRIMRVASQTVQEGARCEHFGSVQSRADLPMDFCLLVGACSRAFVLCARARKLSTLLYHDANCAGSRSE